MAAKGAHSGACVREKLTRESHGSKGATEEPQPCTTIPSPVHSDLEQERVLPVIEAIRKQGIDIPISVDTFRAEVLPHPLPRLSHEQAS